jgi:FkbM family methyltransferase
VSTLLQSSPIENRPHTTILGLTGRLRARADTLVRGLILNQSGRRATIMRKAFFDAAKLVSPSIAMQRDGVWYYVDTHDQVISRATFAYGSYEEDVMARALGILEAHGHAITGRTFVDVGANIGTSTIAAILHFGARDAIAIEAAPSNYRLLRCNVIANDLEERVRTVWGAASSHAGSGRLTLSSWNSGDHRVDPAESAAANGAESVQVPLVRLDDVVGGTYGDVGVVWVDTQGHEGSVLAGAPALLESDVPVIVEYWPHALRDSGGLELFHSLVEEHYDLVVDVRGSDDGGRNRPMAPSEVRRLEDVSLGLGLTDLVLMKRR